MCWFEFLFNFENSRISITLEQRSLVRAAAARSNRNPFNLWIYLRFLLKTEMRDMSKTCETSCKKGRLKTNALMWLKKLRCMYNYTCSCNSSHHRVTHRA